MWWWVPVSPATQEAEAGESLEPRRWRLHYCTPAWATEQDPIPPKFKKIKPWSEEAIKDCWGYINRIQANLKCLNSYYFTIGLKDTTKYIKIQEFIILKEKKAINFGEC